MELVWTHHAVDLVALTLGVEVGDRGPEARDLEHHLGAVVAQEREVPGRLVVVPGVVEDRRVDVALVAAEIRPQRPDSGLRWTSWVSSVPSLPLCQGNIAPAKPASRAAARASSKRR